MTRDLRTSNRLPLSSALDSVVVGRGPVLTVWSRSAPPVPTKVFDTFWRFAAERQEIFHRRLRGQRQPWTDDPILDRYKFTNVYRASDRVSQYLIRHVIYVGDQSPTELFFRTLLFKLFNKVETWQQVLSDIGQPLAATFDVERYDRCLTRVMESGQSIYSGAYIMPTGGKLWHEGRKHRMHLKLLDHMLAQRLPERIARAESMKAAFEILRSVPTIGDFLAYQYVTDLNYSTLTNFAEDEFVIAGPGAREGIRKCFSSFGGLTESEVIRLVYERQDEEFSVRGLHFEPLWGRRLQLIDCQNLFCEVDKYARVHHPEVKGKNGRTRIKQQFRPNRGIVDHWYPPKWGLNERITATNPPVDRSDGLVV